MKKIKTIRELEETKMRLRIRQLELEKEIRLIWKDFKESLEPGKFLKNKLAGITRKEIKEKGIFSSVLNHGAAYLTRKFVDVAGKKIETRVVNTVETITNKIKNTFEGKK
jgi:hypothetical protein